MMTRFCSHAIDCSIKLIAISSAIIFIASCTPGTTPPDARNDLRSTDPVPFDTSSASVEAEADTALLAEIDSSIYVGRIDAFDTTGEYYISIFSLPHREDVDYFQVVAGQADSVVYEDIESRRSRIPMEIAKDYFNLTGLEKISVYNNGQHTTDATLVRVEEFSGPIESQFIAVYKPDTLLPLNFSGSYCVSLGEQHFATEIQFASKELTDNTLTRKLLERFQFDSTQYWSTHVKMMPADVVYSGITLPAQSFLIETIADQSKIVKTIDEGYFIGSIIPVHLHVNGKPVLLLHMGVQESDIIWTSLAVFSGAEYQLLEGSRLSGKVQL